jgi:hypothetical protein
VDICLELGRLRRCALNSRRPRRHPTAWNYLTVTLNEKTPANTDAKKKDPAFANAVSGRVGNCISRCA